MPFPASTALVTFYIMVTFHTVQMHAPTAFVAYQTLLKGKLCPKSATKMCIHQQSRPSDSYVRSQIIQRRNIIYPVCSGLQVLQSWANLCSALEMIFTIF